MKIITHDAGFHADDVIAVALLKRMGIYFEVIRTRDPKILQEGINDPNVFVIDVGGAYAPSMRNFDHHQDLSLPSSAGMIWDFYKNVILQDDDAQKFFGEFIASIDAIDTNRDNIYGLWDTLPKGFRNTSQIISGFNRDVTNGIEQKIQFDEAVNFAMVIIENEIHSAIQKAESDRQYANRVILKNNVAVFDIFNTIWKEKKEHLFAVLPHANGWQIQSRDTSIIRVPETVSDCEGFIFRHASGFMATVKDKAVAIAFAETL